MRRDFDPVLAYDLGMTAKGTALLSDDELVRLTSFAKERNAMVHTVEGYVIEGEEEIAAPEFSIYGPDENSMNLDWPAQIVLAESAVNSLATVARNNTHKIKFKVWLGVHDQ